MPFERNQRGAISCDALLPNLRVWCFQPEVLRRERRDGYSSTLIMQQQPTARKAHSSASSPDAVACERDLACDLYQGERTCSLAAPFDSGLCHVALVRSSRR